MTYKADKPHKILLLLLQAVFFGVDTQKVTAKVAPDEPDSKTATYCLPTATRGAAA